MSEENEPRKHITEALAGKAFVPETHEQREEREATEDYVKCAAARYLPL
ncbi:hypothetical protein F4561_000635 [Lipingzhangella halophila]|uniref:Uncharacterized protein n=1 Tax=Lipingzhangella halophila TaxID=1783352 RepID=A0A7W7RD46_9ACTN|nr:hypothetical protein [Lipingzhangella halophila]